MILGSLFSVGQQVLILFVLIAAGFICTKTGLLGSTSIPGINNIILYVVAPCVIIESFYREYSAAMLSSLGTALLASTAAHILNIAVATLLVREKNAARETVLRFSTVFSNCIFMGLPLQSALLGPDGVFYGASFVALFNILTWTYGFVLMGGRSSGFSAKNLILNPGIIGVAIGLFFFITPFSLPQIILSPLRNMAALNTPLPMIIAGYYLACLKSLKVIAYGKMWLVIFLRLIALPLAETVAFYALGLRGIILVSISIAACAPAAANALIFASKFNRDTELAVTLVSVSTLASIVTMPVVVSISMVLSELP